MSVAVKSSSFTSVSVSVSVKVKRWPESFNIAVKKETELDQAGLRRRDLVCGAVRGQVRRSSNISVVSTTRRVSITSSHV